MGELNGETGASPVLTRNCKSVLLMSQVDRLKGCNHNLADRRWIPDSRFVKVSPGQTSRGIVVKSTHYIGELFHEKIYILVFNPGCVNGLSECMHHCLHADFPT
jgi:hypothetical protein